MDRMNSWKSGIFYPDQFFSNLNKRIKSALKIIKNDSDLIFAWAENVGGEKLEFSQNQRDFLNRETSIF